MNTVINLRPEELTDEFYKHLQDLATVANSIEIKINGVNAVNNLTEPEIANRLQQMADNKTQSFTMQELESYIHEIAG